MGEIYFMDLNLKIIDSAIRLINLLAHCDDADFIDIVCRAVRNGDIGMLLDLEETLDDISFE